MSVPDIRFRFTTDFDYCDITVISESREYSYSGLRVKKVNLRDWENPQIVHLVKIPCAKVIGCDYMICVGMDAIKGYKHPEAAPIVFTPYTDDDEPDEKRKKKKNDDQLTLF